MQNMMQVMLGCIPQYERLVGQLPSEFWLFTVIPLAVCLFGVHLFFRHFVTIAWFSVKLCVAVLVYLQIRNAVTSALETSTPWAIESALFGVPSGTLNTAASLGFSIIKAKGITILREAYARKKSAPESTSWVDWMNDTLFI